MDKYECEHRLEELFTEMVKVAKQYAPGNTYLHASYMVNDGRESISFNNAHFKKTTPYSLAMIDFHKFINRNAPDVQVIRDRVTDSFTLFVNGKIMGEHLANDEVSEILSGLMP